MKIRYVLFVASALVAFSMIFTMGCKKEQISGPTSFTFQGITYAAANASCNSSSTNNTVTSIMYGEIALNVVNEVPTGITILEPISVCSTCPYVTISNGTVYYQAIGGKLSFDGSVMAINATMQIDGNTNAPTYPLSATIDCR